MIKKTLLDTTKLYCRRNKYNKSQPGNPWWTDECARIIQFKRAAWKVYNKKNNEVNYEQYKNLRKKAKNTIKKAKRNYWNAVSQDPTLEEVFKTLRRVNKSNINTTKYY